MKSNEQLASTAFSLQYPGERLPLSGSFTSAIVNLPEVTAIHRRNNLCYSRNFMKAENKRGSSKQPWIFARFANGLSVKKKTVGRALSETRFPIDRATSARLKPRFFFLCIPESKDLQTIGHTVGSLKDLELISENSRAVDEFLAARVSLLLRVPTTWIPLWPVHVCYAGSSIAR